MPDGYGLYLLDRMLRREGSSLLELSPLQRLSLVGNSGMGALCYKPEVKGVSMESVVDGELDELQRKASDGSDWLVKFRHTYDPSDIGRMEYQYMSTAQKCGIVIPQIRLIDGRYFASKRFDINDGKRIHTLTAAALLQSDFRSQNIDSSGMDVPPVSL